MPQRDRLIELIKNAPTTDTVYGDIKLKTPIQTVQTIADYLLANGVVVKTKPQTKGKCGSCVYAEPVVAFGQSSCYVKCTNKEHITKYCKGEVSTLRQRTHLACKKHKEREGK